MNDRRHQKEAYVSTRPPAQGSNVVRLRDDNARAVNIIAECDSAELQHAICEVLRLGYCISWTTTSDGGAVSIVIFDGFTRFKAYARSVAHFERSLHDLLQLARGEE